MLNLTSGSGAPVDPSPRPFTEGGSVTTTTLTLSAAKVPAGTAVTLTAQVISGATRITPGIVDFCNGIDSLCQGAAVLASGVLNAQGQSVTTLRLTAGTYQLVARFQGTAAYTVSVSAPETLIVEENSNNTTKLTLTSVTGSKGQYTLGAVLSSHAPAAPTGSVVFTDATDNVKFGGAPLPAATLGGFQPFGLISTGAKSGPNDLVTADFNGDGIEDLAVPDSATGVVAVFLGKGDGTFQPAMNASTGLGSTPLALAVGDFNGDGKPDMAVALGNIAAVAILLGNGDGTFAPAQTIPTAGSILYYPIALAVGDFNHDGRLDIATANNQVGVSVLLGNGNGSFQPYKSLGTDKGPSWIAAGDFNNDGVPDLAVTTSSDTIDILLGNGDGTFAAWKSIATGPGTNPQSVTVADFDGDGNLDLAVACYGANAAGVLLGNGDGTFLPIDLYAAGAGPISVTTGDLNRDGVPDLVVTNLNANSLSLFQGNGDGTFLPMPGYSTTSASQPAASVVADLDSEGTQEIVTALYGSSALYVLEPERMQGVTLRNVPLSVAGTIDLAASYAGDAVSAAATSATYQFTASATTAVAPLFSPAAGSYPAAQSVTLASTTPGAQIYYTTSGTAPTAKSTLYSQPIAVNASTTIQAIAIASGYSNSSVAKARYVIGTPAAAPVFTPAAGAFTGAQNVTLKSATAGATIYYTLNGSTPTTTSAKYSAPIKIDASTTIKAMAAAPGSLDSSVAAAAYRITQPTLTLSTNVTAPKAEESITLTATLHAPNAKNLSGTWTIFNGATKLCSSAGTTQVKFACPAKLAHGTHLLTAAYAGKANGWKLKATLALAVN